MNTKIKSSSNTRGAQKAPRLHCAIYTRKSAEEGLDQDFNSLDAQREACAAYVTSQSSLGWRLSPKHYDDGGISGGTMERPALKQLLKDVKAGLIDIIVVYKIDRLTRSLMDFSKMVDLFDDKGISFASVTQQFNTTTSMGRLTLNVLLSFAQFEREVTAERIKDKIAASKKKGMWMGGVIPLGYKTKDKKLIINKQEANIVESLYSRYLALGSVTKLSKEASEIHPPSKQITLKICNRPKGCPFTRGNLYHLLSNPIYIGKIKHKDQIYDGQHDAIIEEHLWNDVQEKLKVNARKRQSKTNSKSPNLFTGLIYDETDELLSPTHSNKKGKRYYYYISKTSKWRLQAKHLDETILNILIQQFQNPLKLSNFIDLDELNVTEQTRIIKAASQFAKKLENANGSTQKELLKTIIDHIQLKQNEIIIHVMVNGFYNLELEKNQSSSRVDPIIKTIFHAHQLQKRGVETKLILSDGASRKPSRDKNLIMLVAKANLWLQKLSDGSTKTISELANKLNEDRNEISRLLPLAFLSPAITQSIFDGTQPISLTTERLRRLSHIPMDWDEQHQLLGFNS